MDRIHVTISHQAYVLVVDDSKSKSSHCFLLVLSRLAYRLMLNNLFHI